jgi:CHASE3 domain sensor protein
MLCNRNATPRIVALALALALPFTALPAGHVVPRADLHREAAAASGKRELDLTRARKFFSSETAQTALGKAAAGKIEKAVALLDADELNRLTSRIGTIERDIAAGALSNQELTYIVIALGTAVLILVIVAA